MVNKIDNECLVNAQPKPVVPLVSALCQNNHCYYMLHYYWCVNIKDLILLQNKDFMIVH